jgi:hypothetical protein
VVLTDSKLLGNPLLRMTRFSKFADFLNVEFRKLWARPPSFSNAVSHVVLFCSNPQVVRSNTLGIVALVEHAFSFWHWPVVQYPRGDMGEYEFVSNSSSKPSVTVMGSSSRPNPTGFGFVNSGEPSNTKGFGKTLRCQIFGRKLDTHWLIICAFGLQAQRAFSLFTCSSKTQ